MTAALAGAAAGAVLATAVATYAGVRLRREMPIVTWRAWVAGFPLKPVAWVLATAATLAMAATAVVALVTGVAKQNHPAVAYGDHPSPAVIPGTTSDPPRRHQVRAAAGPAAPPSRLTPSAPAAVSPASYPPSPSRSPGRNPSPQPPSLLPVPPLSPAPTPTPTPTPTPIPTSAPTSAPIPSRRPGGSCCSSLVRRPSGPVASALRPAPPGPARPTTSSLCSASRCDRPGGASWT
jgi:hypothetical protein